jgi:branched-chain amino acid transport system ATP-binding protein
MGEKLLQIEDLHRSFGGVKAVNGVTFEVARGQIKSVIGPNGAGKTTLFNLISGLLVPEAGTIRQNGREITGLSPFRIAELGVCRTFQTTRLFPEMTLLENVMVGRHPRTRAGFLAGLLSLPWTWREEAAIREQALELLRTLQLSDRAEQPAASLPFGKQRLAEIAGLRCCSWSTTCPW